ncbi:WXG100 family type VII secretion target [Nocardia sp. NPDC058640]|uniref:WXG100 family type VII secretion target n=1 Tax=Nocardia sp. NPDC058640 TaxID=3346571 RepID=UPI003665AE7A
MAMRSLSGRTDADYAPVVEVFDNLSHAEIHQAVRQLDPAALSTAAQTFLTTATSLGDGVDIAHGEIRAAIADGWRGAAAQQAADAVGELEQAGRRIADVLTAVGVRLHRAGDAAESIRAAVAEPVAAQPDPSAALLDSEQAAANATIAREAENARLDAVQAMEMIYAGAFLPTGSGVPAFTGIDTGTGTVVAGTPTSSAGTGTQSATVLTPATPSATVASPTVAGPVVASPAVAGATVAAGFTSTAAPTTPGSQPAGGSATAPALSPSASTGTPAAAPNTSPPANSTLAPSNPHSPSAPIPPTSGAASPGNRTRPASASNAPAGTPTSDDATAFPDVASNSSTATTDAGAAGNTTAATLGAHGTTPTTAAADADAADTGEMVGAAAGEVAGAGSQGQQERDPAVSGGEAAAGMGAGAIGGMMGGAMAAAEQTRPSSGPRPAPVVEDPEDEDDEYLRLLEEEPTFLEPADEVNALIGKMEPTSPAVLGEWTEQE